MIHGTRLHRSTMCTTRLVTLHISSSMRIKELSSLMNKFISLTARSNFRDVALVKKKKKKIKKSKFIESFLFQRSNLSNYE